MNFASRGLGAPRAVGGVEPQSRSRSRSRSKTSLRASTRAPTTRLLRNDQEQLPTNACSPRAWRSRPVLLRPLERRWAGRRRHVRRLRRCLADHLQVHCVGGRRGGLGRRRPPVGGARGQQRQGAAPRGRRAERGGARRLGRAGRVGGAPVVRRHDDAERHAGRVRQHRVDRRRLAARSTCRPSPTSRGSRRCSAAAGWSTRYDARRRPTWSGPMAGSCTTSRRSSQSSRPTSRSRRRRRAASSATDPRDASRASRARATTSPFSTRPRRAHPPTRACR